MKILTLAWGTFCIFAGFMAIAQLNGIAGTQVWASFASGACIGAGIMFIVNSLVDW